MKKIWIQFVVLFLYSGIIVAQNKVVHIDLSGTIGQPKKLLSVNAGPDSAVKGYQECGINQIRTHDYYGPCDYWTYTINALDYGSQTIHPAFNPQASTSYQWTNSDNKIDSIINFGFTPFFRLGISWPNSTNVPIFPPIDPSLNSFSKFASICKHTVMHYTTAWSKGRNYDIPYWEVWNEPDFAEKFWFGTHATPLNYFRMYQAVADSIKAFNPQLKVGAPGLTYKAMLFSERAYREDFIAYCRLNNLPLDFYSWHLYDVKNPYAIKAYGDTIRNILDQNGFYHTESIITEINPGLGAPQYNNTVKGATWIVSALITTNFSKVDNFFWYKGTLLGPLVLADVNNTANLNWNSHAYIAYKNFLNAVDSLVQHNGDEYNTTDFRNDVNNFMTIAGKSVNGDTVSLLVSNLNSAHNTIEIVINSIPWTGNTTIEQYSIRAPNDKLALTKTNKNVSNGSLSHVINNAAHPCAFLIKVYKSAGSAIENFMNATALTIYPSPTHDMLMISNANNDNFDLMINNIFGQEVMSVKNYNGNYIDISHLKNGVYFVTDGISIVKFIKL